VGNLKGGDGKFIVNVCQIFQRKGEKKWVRRKKRLTVTPLIKVPPGSKTNVGKTKKRNKPFLGNQRKEGCEGVHGQRSMQRRFGGWWGGGGGKKGVDTVGEGGGLNMPNNTGKKKRKIMWS